MTLSLVKYLRIIFVFLFMKNMNINDIFNRQETKNGEPHDVGTLKNN